MPSSRIKLLNLRYRGYSIPSALTNSKSRQRFPFRAAFLADSFPNQCPQCRSVVSCSHLVEITPISLISYIVFPARFTHFLPILPPISALSADQWHGFCLRFSIINFWHFSAILAILTPPPTPHFNPIRPQDNPRRPKAERIGRGSQVAFVFG